MVHSDPHTRAAPAEVYERLFVPALFRQWGPVVLDAAAYAQGTTCSTSLAERVR